MWKKKKKKKKKKVARLKQWPSGRARPAGAEVPARDAFRRPDDTTCKHTAY
jgi:hypothetical protein